MEEVQLFIFYPFALISILSLLISYATNDYNKENEKENLIKI